jgi:hypothetical protein
MDDYTLDDVDGWCMVGGNEGRGALPFFCEEAAMRTTTIEPRDVGCPLSATEHWATPCEHCGLERRHFGMEYGPEDEAEAERTAEHARMTGAQHVAFYGLFYVRRSGWTKARQWIVWERAMALLNTAIAPGSALAAFPKAAGLLEPQAATSAARRDGIISESKS